ncbi:aspartate aminotransferase family protein [Roseibium album]|uniref:aspartate aminotransferase family protein n=1 Tax=Roseibium album TaxID=311410 RepID=UPI003918F85F
MSQRAEDLFHRASKVIAGGVNSFTRSQLAGWRPFPLFIRGGHGSRVQDSEGREFLDCIMGLGAVFPGHREPTILEAVTRHIEQVGSVFALPIEEEALAAETLVRLVPTLEQVRFCNTGTEAILFAVRLARKFTDRKKILTFEGMYHGFGDAVYFSKDRIVIPWNDTKSLDAAIDLHGTHLAAVLTEPIMCNRGYCASKPGYLNHLAERTRNNGSLLIFDEVITGFRAAIGGAQDLLGVQPDLTVLGKALGGGYPVACLGGSTNIMQLVTDDRVRMMGTFSANGIAVAAMIASLQLYETSDNFKRVFNLGSAVREQLKQEVKDLGMPATVDGIGSVFQIHFNCDSKVDNKKLFEKWWQGMLNRKILIHPDPNEVVFLSMAHIIDDVNYFIDCARETLKSL